MESEYVVDLAGERVGGDDSYVAAKARAIREAQRRGLPSHTPVRIVYESRRVVADTTVAGLSGC